MKALFLCLVVASTSACFLSRAASERGVPTTNSPVVEMVNPQGSVDLPKLGQAIFREQASSLSLQIPIGFREHGKLMDTNNPVLQVWLLKADGSSIAQLSKPSVVSIGAIGDFSTNYRFYEFQKVPADELAGVALSLNGKFYCHEVEMSNRESAGPSSEGTMFQISPANISNSPISVQVTNWDSSERFTVFYKADKTSGKFLNAVVELSDAGSVISSDPVQKSWATNGFRFYFSTGYVWPFKFKIMEKAHQGEAPMPGSSGYWFYLHDFATNPVANAHQTVKIVDGWMREITMDGLNEPVSFTEQSEQFTVQMAVATYRNDEKHTFLKANELHRQVWLLRPDGTSIPQLREPVVVGAGGGGFMTLNLMFTFPKKLTNEVAGIVASVNGKLFCQELPSGWNQR